MKIKPNKKIIFVFILLYLVMGGRLSLAETNGVDNSVIGTKDYGFAVYTGEMQNGLAHGKGTVVFEIGAKYTGELVRDEQHGKGTMIWANGDKYVGDWVRDERSGKGTLVLAGGEKYIGDWVRNERHGKGTATWPNGNKYVGDWVRNESSGKGTLTLANGNKYVGDWVRGEMSGRGIIAWANGDELIGEWANNSLITTYKDTRTQETKSDNRILGTVFDVVAGAVAMKGIKDGDSDLVSQAAEIANTNAQLHGDGAITGALKELPTTVDHSTSIEETTQNQNISDSPNYESSNNPVCPAAITKTCRDNLDSCCIWVNGKSYIDAHGNFLPL